MGVALYVGQGHYPWLLRNSFSLQDQEVSYDIQTLFIKR